MNIRVDARVVANGDGQTDVRTDRRKTGSLSCSMPEAGATIKTLANKKEKISG